MNLATVPGRASDARPRSRHPWLAGADWLVDAADALLEDLDAGDEVVLSVRSERDRPATGRVRVESARTPDEIDDMRGIRRLERRVAEVAALVPARPPFGAVATFARDRVVVEISWALPGRALLIATRRDDGWRAYDAVTLPARHLHLSRDDVLRRAPEVLAALGRLIGGGRISPDTRILSAQRREEEYRFLLEAGCILP